MVERGHLAETFEVGGFAGENVVFGDGFEGFGGEGEIHRMTGATGKINGESGENGVHGFDPTKPPTAVGAEATVGELDEGFDLSAFDFSRHCQFFKFFSHKIIANFASPTQSDTI